MRGVAVVMLLGVVLGLPGCVVYDDDHDYGYRGGYGHWDDGDRHRHWEGHGDRHRDWERREHRRERWEGRRDGDHHHRRHDDDDD